LLCLPDIGPGEIVALEQQRQSRAFRQSVRKAIRKIERDRMAALAIGEASLCGEIDKVGVDRDDVDAGLQQPVLAAA
jgi:hypothetical protein